MTKFPFLQKVAAWANSFLTMEEAISDSDTEVEVMAKIEKATAIKTGEQASELATQFAALQTQYTELVATVTTLQATVTENANTVNTNFQGVQTLVTDMSGQITTMASDLRREVSAAIAGVKTGNDTNNDLNSNEKNPPAGGGDGKVVKFEANTWKKPTSQVRVSQ